jgi:CBS domain-containing protein
VQELRTRSVPTQWLRERSYTGARPRWRAACSATGEEGVMQPDPETPTRRIYRGRGTAPETVPIPLLPTVPELSPRISATAVPLHQIMTRDVICGSADLDIRVVVDLMLKHHIGCIPIVDSRQRPIGIITKSDIVEHVHAALAAADEGAPLPEDLKARTADDLMMPLAFSLSAYATVAHAAMMMIGEDTHHVMVVSPTEELVGVVSSRDLVDWVLHTDGP